VGSCWTQLFELRMKHTHFHLFFLFCNSFCKIDKTLKIVMMFKFHNVQREIYLFVHLFSSGIVVSLWSWVSLRWLKSLSYLLQCIECLVHHMTHCKFWFDFIHQLFLYQKTQSQYLGESSKLSPFSSMNCYRFIVQQPKFCCPLNTSDKTWHWSKILSHLLK
jgi:hypothetical protein